MPRHAPELECSVEDKASLVALAKSRTAEAHAVERARIILACLEGKEIQQVARELGVAVATVSKWRQRFSLWGLRGLRDQPFLLPPDRSSTYGRRRAIELMHCLGVVLSYTASNLLKKLERFRSPAGPERSHFSDFLSRCDRVNSATAVFTSLVTSTCSAAPGVSLRPLGGVFPG